LYHVHTSRFNHVICNGIIAWGISIFESFDYTHENNTCTQAQYGGEKDLVTIDALYLLISHIQIKKLEGRVVYCVMLDFETVYPLVSRPQLYTYLHEQDIQGQKLAVIKSLTKSLKVQVLHPHIPVDDCIDIERGLAEGSALSPRLYGIFLGSLLRNLRENFPIAQCTGAQWIGALAYVDDLKKINKMITVAQYWS